MIPPSRTERTGKPENPKGKCAPCQVAPFGRVSAFHVIDTCSQSLNYFDVQIMIESCYAGATPTLSISVIAAGVECQDEFINLFRLIDDLPISQRKKGKKST
jgi:hypothetical protein